jgi:hypothetical protein
MRRVRFMILQKRVHPPTPSVFVLGGSQCIFQIEHYQTPFPVDFRLPAGAESPQYFIPTVLTLTLDLE